MNAALKAEGRSMGVIGRDESLAVKEVRVDMPGKKFWVIYYIDHIGHPFALDMVEVEGGAAVKTSTRMVPFSEVADWMGPGDFAEVDVKLVQARADLIRLLGPLRPFLEG